MKKLLLTAFALIGGLTVSAQWTKPTIETKGDIAVDDVVYLYNEGAQMFLTQGNAYGTQASVAEEGLMIKVAQYVANEDDEWDGKTYTIQDFRPLQQQWYYMFIDEKGGCYMDRASQADYLWEFAKQENGSYRIFAANANPTFNPTSNPNSCAGVVRVDGSLKTWVNPIIDLNEKEDGTEYYLDWVFISEEDYAPYAEKLKVYNIAQQLRATLDECSTRGLDTSNLEKVYANTSSTLDELLAAQKAAEALISADDEKSVTPDNPQDFTARIANPDFLEGKAGWQCEYTGPQKSDVPKVDSWVPVTEDEVMVSPAVSIWLANESSRYWQVVENIPNGIYEVSAGIFSQSNGPVFYANDARTSIPTCNPTKYTLLTYVQDNTMEIGITTPAEGVQWMMADCFRLKYYGNGYEAYKMWVDQTLAGTSGFEEVACNHELRDNYNSSLDKLFSAASQEELVAELPHFLTLFNDLKTNVAAYEVYQTLTDDAVKMVMDGSYAGDDFDVLSDYAAGESDPGDEFEKGSAQYILKNGNLTTEEVEAETEYLKQLIQNTIDNCMAVGADATGKIVNAAFDEGLKGWTHNKKLGTPAPGGMTANPNVERWNENFDFYQEVDLPNGVYQLDAQAFYRTASNTMAVGEWNDGTAEVLTELYANTGSVLVKNVYSEAQEKGFYKENNAFAMDDTQEVPNSMNTASEAFTAGLYDNTVKGVVWDGKLRIGIRSLNASESDRWSIWDNFRLTFLGYETEAIEECHKQTVAEAEELMDGDLTDEMQKALLEAIETSVDYTDARGTLDTIAKIRAAMNEANNYATAISETEPQQAATIAGIYTPNGMRVNALQKGINLIRMSDNTIKKVWVK